MSLEIDIGAAVEYVEKKLSKIKSNRDLDILIEKHDNSENPSIVCFPLTRVENLGQGSSSVVYKSVLLKSLQVCAEKVFITADPNKKILLHRELELLKLAFNDSVEAEVNRLTNFLVRPLEILTNPFDGTLSLCLEYMDGGSLQDMIKLGGCKNEVVLASIAYQSLCGLSYLHGLRLIHRDIKPSNILVSLSGRVKLADFGLAKSLDMGMSLADSFVGTFDYMAPERLTGEPYSFQSDVWSYGLTLHSVAIGKYPYETKNRGYWELLHATNDGKPPLPSEDLFSAAFVDIVRVCGVKDVKARPAAISLLSHAFVAARCEVIPDKYLVSAKAYSKGSSVIKAEYLANGALPPAAARLQRSNSSKTTLGYSLKMEQIEMERARISQLRVETMSSRSGPATAEETQCETDEWLRQSPLQSLSPHPQPPSAMAFSLKDIYKIVKNWKSFIVQWHRSHPSDTRPTPEQLQQQELRQKNVLWSGPVSTNSVPSQNLTEELVTSLARDLQCDRELLKQSFCHAILDIKKQFAGSVSVLPGGTPLSSRSLKHSNSSTPNNAESFKFPGSARSNRITPRPSSKAFGTPALPEDPGTPVLLEEAEILPLPVTFAKDEAAPEPEVAPPASPSRGDEMRQSIESAGYGEEPFEEFVEPE